MGRLLGFVFLIFFSMNAIAGLVFEGSTLTSQKCAIELNFENNNVVFNWGSNGFGFWAQGSEVQSAISSGKPFELQGSDGPYEAKLLMVFSADGNLKSAIYNQKKVFFTKTIRCEDLKKRG